MLETIFGLFLLFFPLIPLVFVGSKVSNFLKLLCVIIYSQLTIGIVLQALKVFSYQNVLLASLFMGTAICIWILKTVEFADPTVSRKMVTQGLALLVVMAGAVCLLSQVHFNYNGLYSILGTPDYQKAEDLHYVYPYYSDEWYAVSLANTSIEKSQLPSVNPFDQEAGFPNFEMAFHSFLAESFLLLSLDPINDFTKLSVGLNAFLILSSFLLAFKLSKNLPASLLASYLLLFITVGANLPGIWNLIPVSMGLFSLIISTYFILKKTLLWATLSGVLTLIFYPPLIVFWFPLFIFNFVIQEYNKDFCLVGNRLLIGLFAVLSASHVVATFYFARFDSQLSTYLTTVLVMISFLLLPLALSVTYRLFKIDSSQLKIFYFSLGALLLTILVYLINFIREPKVATLLTNAVYEKLFYQSFIPGFIPQYPIYAVVPLITLPFFVIGLTRLYKNHKAYLLPVGVGLLFWFFYSLTTLRIIIDYQRVVFVTAVLITIGASCGIAVILSYVKNFKVFSQNEKLYHYSLLAVAVLIVVVLSFGYTERDNWQKLVLVSKDGDRTAMPVAPANTFLHPDDIRVFENLGPVKFLSLDWKGTVIGVATDAIPIVTKPGTISMNVGLLPVFAEADCQEKIEILKKHEADYLYWPPLNCPGLVEEDESTEGLVLYKVSE